MSLVLGLKMKLFAASLCSLLLISGCSLLPSNDPPNSGISVEAAYIADEGGGLGDTRVNFDDRRSEGDELSDSTVAYQNGYLRAVFVDGADFDIANGRAQQIQVSFESTNTPVVSLEKALEIAADFLPSDAIKVDEHEAPDGFYHVQYRSESLADVIDDGWFHGGEPGDVTVTFWQRDNNADQIFAITIATGGIIK